jgi:hypothetical protein
MSKKKTRDILLAADKTIEIIWHEGEGDKPFEVIDHERGSPTSFNTLDDMEYYPQYFPKRPELLKQFIPLISEAKAKWEASNQEAGDD